jgi:hypothetical protein
VLLSIIDPGALASARIDGEVSGDRRVLPEPKVGFAQVFSPGLYGVLGFRGAPVVVGAGYALAPNLRKVETTVTEGGTTTTTVTARSAGRLSVFLAVDVTMFGL